ncbi:MAG: helix-turn-helix domain-containing protein [Staphylococcus sp.]|nr:helix-turn-helix domain-containing protein [Staphylococcus sp.]
MAEEFDPKTQSRFEVGVTNGKSWNSGQPLNVSGCRIMLCERGFLDITINSKSCKMSVGEMAFIVFDMVVVPIKVSDDFSAKFVDIDYDTAQDIFFLITSNRFWEYIYTSPVFSLRQDMKEVANRWFDILDWIVANCAEIVSEKVLRNETENFMLVMSEQIENQLGLLGTNPPKNRAWVIVNEFLGLLNRYYTHRHDVAFYADRLNISPNYLNIIIKRNIGTTAKEQINIQLGLVVKMLLDTTDLTVKEIAERLHYDDASYLCRIFRKQNGISPIQYRNRQRSL